MRPKSTPTPQQPAGKLDGDTLSIVRQTLPNGLRVWVKPRPGTGTVAILGQFPVGSRHETKANNGISHFLEHMVFTGTRRWGEHEVMEVIRRQGGQVNARTAREDTIYYLHLKADDLSLGIEWMNEILFCPTLTAEKFRKEREVIITEKGGSFGRLEDLFEWIEDRGWGWNVFRAVRHRLWGADHSLQLPVIGRDASLNAITHQQLLDFYKQHYLPNNLTLLFVGDCDPQDVIERVAARFGEFPSGTLPPRPAPPPDPPPNKGLKMRLSGPSVNEQGQLLLSAPIPGLFHPDRYPLLVLSEIMDSVLTRQIRFERGLVYGIESYPAMYTDIGYFVIYTTAESQHFDEITAAVLAEIKRAQTGDIEERELQEARDGLRGRALLSMQGNINQAWWLSDESMYTPDDQPIPDYLAAIEAVTLADVKRVAHQYLGQNNLIDIRHQPGITPARAAKPAMAISSALLVGTIALIRRRRRRKRQNR